MLPELARALEKYLDWLSRRWELSADLPLFLSRENNADGTARALSREAARLIIHRAFSAGKIENDGRLGTHSLRKTWARNVYRNAGNDLMILRAALGHSDISVTQKYLEADENEVSAAISKCDFTRFRRPRNLTPAA
jgi:integrase